MKGVILAGGEGTRLRPLTLVANKHLLPIYNKPMVQFPIETLRALGITDILIVTGGDKVGKFADYLEDGSELGVNITYRVQRNAGGIAHALALAEEYVGDNRVAVILGDNVFDNAHMKIPKDEGDIATIYSREVKNPERFGVIGYDKNGKVKSITEKPKKPESNDVVVGLYIYPPNVFDVIRTLKPSDRGELEITDVNNRYLKAGKLDVKKFEGFWSDAGTFDSLLKSANWVSGYE